MFPSHKNLSDYERHKKIIGDYFSLKKRSNNTVQHDTSLGKTDADVIREHYKFIWDEDSDIPNSWEMSLAKKYYDKLFKEYCLCDLSCYKKSMLALRWRTEKEVISGKGQFRCGNKNCVLSDNLRSWEVNFGYIEHGEKKNALVKLRLCPECSSKLNYHSQKRELKRKKSLKRLGQVIESKVIPMTSTTADAVIKVEEEETKEMSAIENTNESKIWEKKPANSDKKSREEEFEEYFQDLFM